MGGLNGGNVHTLLDQPSSYLDKEVPEPPIPESEHIPLECHWPLTIIDDQL